MAELDSVENVAEKKAAAGKPEHAGAEDSCLEQKLELERRLSVLPNTPAGRKVRAFISEVDDFFNRWTRQKETADARYDMLSDDEKMKLILSAMERQPEFSGLSAEEKMQKFEEKVESNRQGNMQGMTFAEAREKLTESTVKIELYNQLAVSFINSRFNPDFDPALNKGYCTASIMQCLRKADKSGELDAIFNTDIERLAHPATLFKHLQEIEDGKYADHVYKSGEKGCPRVQDIIDKFDIKPGALVCLTINDEKKAELREDGHNHLVLYTGKNREGEHCFYSFNNDFKDGKLKNANVGYVCDSCNMFKDMIRDYHRVYVRGGYMETAENGDVKTGKLPKRRQPAREMPAVGVLAHTVGGRD